MTKHEVDFAPTADPLLRHPHLSHSVSLPILGVETRFESNSVYIRDLAEQTFNGGAAMPAGDTTPVPVVHVRIIVHDGNEHAAGHAAVQHISASDGRLIVLAPGSVAIVDGSRRESLAYVTTALAADREHFRVEVLEAITFALLACFDRHPIHAAAIVQGGRAVLLAGASGMGKSTLTYLAHTSGIDVLSDDRVWVELHPALRIWAGPLRVRLLGDASSHFPELSRLDEPIGGDGKSKRSVAFTGQTCTVPADRAVVCVLTRGAKVALDRIAGSVLREELAGQLAPGFDRFPERQDVVLRTLTAEGGWRLTLSDNPHDALPLLHRMLDEA